jgi:hypothetical protein
MRTNKFSLLSGSMASVFPRLLVLMALGAMSVVFIMAEPASSASTASDASEKSGRIQHQFDLQFSDEGEISGWITVVSEGRVAAIWRDWLAADGHDMPDFDRRGDLCGKLNGYLLPFFPNARVVDAVTESAFANDARLVAKAYIIIPGGGAPVSTIRFPFNNDLLPDTGTDPRRKNDFPAKQNTVGISFSIRLPHGATTPVLPNPFQVKTPAITMDARWNYEGGICRADAIYSVSKTSVPAREFGEFFQAIQRFREWLKQPLTFAGKIKSETVSKALPKATREKSRSNAPESSPGTKLDFPRMFSGEGQLMLADIRYPPGLPEGIFVIDVHQLAQGNSRQPSGIRNDPALTRAALEKTIEYFPDDKRTVFIASVRLAVFDSDHARGRWQEAKEKLTRLLANYKDAVDRNTLAWGRLALARQLSKPTRDRSVAERRASPALSPRDHEAFAILEDVATDTHLSWRNRFSAAFDAWNMLRDTQPGKLVPLFARVTDLASARQPEICIMMTQLCIDAGEMGALRKQIEALLQTRPDDGLDILGIVVNSSTMWPQFSDGAKLARIAAFAVMVKELIPNPSPRLQKTLDHLRQRIAERTKEIGSSKKI